MSEAPPEVIVVGVSLGGLDALRTLLGALPADFPAPVAIVQHRHARSGTALEEILRASTALPVGEPDDKEPLQDGRVYLAPPDYHLLLARAPHRPPAKQGDAADGRPEDAARSPAGGWCELSVDPPVRSARPSIDVLFESAADAYGERLIAVVLTGANADGADGALRVARRGGTVVVQDPATAVAPAMPEAALGRLTDAGLPCLIRPLEDIAPLLVELTAR